MADWDDDSPRLQANLSAVLRSERDRAAARRRLTSHDALAWHKAIMVGLEVPDPARIGQFRGAHGFEEYQVHVGGRLGVLSAAVVVALTAFDQKFFAALVSLDDQIPPGTPFGALDRDRLNAVVNLCAWVHAEWVRIHPFANGNGRTARLWANVIAMRYGLPSFVRLRPRPDGGYGDAGAAAMDGDWHPTAAVFLRLLAEDLQTYTRPGGAGRPGR